MMWAPSGYQMLFAIFKLHLLSTKCYYIVLSKVKIFRLNIVYWKGVGSWGFYIVGDECFGLCWSCKKHENHFMVNE
jgi:hypothetical protein